MFVASPWLIVMLLTVKVPLPLPSRRTDSPADRFVLMSTGPAMPDRAGVDVRQIDGGSAGEVGDLRGEVHRAAAIDSAGRWIPRHIERDRGGSARVRVGVRDRWHFVLGAELCREHDGARVVRRGRRAVAAAGRREHQCRSNCCKSFHWSSSEGYCRFECRRDPGIRDSGSGEPSCVRIDVSDPWSSSRRRCTPVASIASCVPMPESRAASLESRVDSV